MDYFFRAVRDGLSSTSSLLQELTDVNDLDIKATDNFQRNAFHYAVSKPDTLRILLEKLTEIVSFVRRLFNGEIFGKIN